MNRPATYKRYCKTLTLRDDRELIEAYVRAHAIGNVWPEVTEGMKQIGILDMEIYIDGNRLFMIMDTVPGFDHDRAMGALSEKPRQSEWEAFVSRFQRAAKGDAASDKWRLMERIFELDQTEQYQAREGQRKTCPAPE